MEKVRIGIVGTGGMGRTRAKWIHSNKNAEIAAICDITEKAKEVAKQYDAPLITRYEQLLEQKDIDAVTLSIPNSLHFSYTVQALEAGKHVLVEYPIAATTEEAKKMAEVSAEKNLILHPGHTMRFEPQHIMIKEKLPLIGRLVFTTIFLWYGRRISGWYADPEARGDTFTFLNYHHIDQFRDLFGEVAWVDGNLDDKIGPDGKFIRTSGILMLGFANGGCAFTMQGHGLLAPNDINRCIVGEHGYLEEQLGENIYDFQQEKLFLVIDKGREQIPLPSIEPYQEDTNNFINEILGKSKIVIPPEEGIKTVEVCNAAARSAKEGKRIYITS